MGVHANGGCLWVGGAHEQVCMRRGRGGGGVCKWEGVYKWTTNGRGCVCTQMREACMWVRGGGRGEEVRKGTGWGGMWQWQHMQWGVVQCELAVLGLNKGSLFMLEWGQDQNGVCSPTLAVLFKLAEALKRERKKHTFCMPPHDLVWMYKWGGWLCRRGGTDESLGLMIGRSDLLVEWEVQCYE